MAREEENLLSGHVSLPQSFPALAVFRLSHIYCRGLGMVLFLLFGWVVVFVLFFQLNKTYWQVGKQWRSVHAKHAELVSLNEVRAQLNLPCHSWGCECRRDFSQFYGLFPDARSGLWLLQRCTETCQAVASGTPVLSEAFAFQSITCFIWLPGSMPTDCSCYIQIIIGPVNWIWEFLCSRLFLKGRFLACSWSHRSELSTVKGFFLLSSYKNKLRSVCSGVISILFVHSS